MVRSTQYGGKPTSLTLLPKSLKRPKSGVRLVIPKKNMLVQHDNESRYIKMYLINSSSDTILVDRADATVIGISTEVFADGEWKIFQTITGSSCGNSYWKMTMQPKNFLYIELENKTKGPLKALYRVRLKIKCLQNHSRRLLEKILIIRPVSLTCSFRHKLSIGLSNNSYATLLLSVWRSLGAGFNGESSEITMSTFVYINQNNAICFT